MKRTALLLTVASLALVAPAAHAQSDFGLRSVGAAIGFVDPENLGTTFSLGVFADHGNVAPRIGLESRLEVWSQSDQYLGTKTSVRDVTLGVRGKYRFETANAKLRPFAGLGLGLHFLKGELTVPPQSGLPGFTVGSSSTELGLDLGGGVATPLGPRTDLQGESWFGFVDGANTFSLRAAVAFRLGS